MSFKDFLFREESLAEAALIIGGNRTRAYPRSGHMMILVGGAGSGKGFINNNFIAFQGKVFNVDDLKDKLLKLRPPLLVKKFEEFSGRYIQSISMSNPGDVALMHMFFKKEKLDKRIMDQFFAAASTATEKPNVIFDVTLKDIKKLKDISNYAEIAGYDKKNIHIVWIMNDIKIAFQQNQKRERTVPEEIFMETHIGAAMTMKELMDNSQDYRKYADGEIWVLPNKAHTDNSVTFNKEKKVREVLFYTAFKIKNIGQVALSSSEVEQAIFDKVKEYVPEESKW